MALKFDATNFAVTGLSSSTVSISFNLIDDTAPTVILASTIVSINVAEGSTAQQAKTQIAGDCRIQLQAFYNNWKTRTSKVTDWLSSNEEALETYLSNNIVW